GPGGEFGRPRSGRRRPLRRRSGRRRPLRTWSRRPRRGFCGPRSGRGPGRAMTGYIIRRVLWGLVLLVLVAALTFVLFRILPTADPARLRAGHNASPRVIAEIRHDLGLDKPLLTQFW